MSQLTNEQLQLLTMLNKARLTITQEFKNNVQPSGKVLLKELLLLEVVMMENKYKEHLGELMQENHMNVAVLINHMLVRDEKDDKGKKLSIKWKNNNESSEEFVNKNQDREVRSQDGNNFKKGAAQLYKQTAARQTELNFCRKQPNIQAKHTEATSRMNELQSIDKNKIPPGEFISASILPKGTSVRKKFVPPFKKQQPPLKELQQKPGEQEDGEKIVFKNLQEKLVNTIMSQILETNAQVKWSSIAGLGFAKRIIHQMIVWPMQRPDIFTGMRAPPRAILLFGPPGTGKTMIGRAIASQASATFFSISASSLTSKWVGESEKLVKTLFAIARAKQPSVIFIDEIDSLLSARSEGEQESSRRVKTEFLIELDGTKTNTNQRVLIIGATNLPKELDDAVRRRFVKRLYIPLPNFQGRAQLITTLTSNNAFRLTEEDIQKLAAMTKGFSGADLYTLCSQASMIPLRQMTSIQNIRHSEVPFSELKHFLSAFKLVRPSVNKLMLKSFQMFNEQYGSYQFTPDQLEDEESGNANAGD